MPEIPLWVAILGPIAGYGAAWLVRRSTRESTIVARWNVAENELRLSRADNERLQERIDALRADREKIRDQKHSDNERLQESLNETIKEYERMAGETAVEHQRQVDEMKRCCDVKVAELIVKLANCQERMSGSSGNGK